MQANENYIKKSIKSITPPKYILSIALPIAPLDIINKDNLINLSLVKKQIINRMDPIIRKNVKKYLLSKPPSLKAQN